MSPNKSVTSAQISIKLLHWYDEFGREMPWRVSPADQIRGILPNPYHIWLSEIMLQQTQVVTVTGYFQAFLSNWPEVHDLANAKDADVMARWAGLGYYARARNLLKTARIISKDFSGIFPKTEAGLRALPGVGPYTAAAITAIAHGQKATVLDGNIERVMARLFLVTAPLPDSKPTLYDLAAKATPDARVGDYVQGLMDLGATICTPRSPDCGNCPIRPDCRANATGNAESLPRKLAKKPKPTRNGIVYFAYTDAGKMLLETRPQKGLLGGMLALPSSEWVTGTPEPAPPISANWQVLPEQIRHVFTHFKLNLTVHMAKISGPEQLQDGFADFPDPNILPTVMRKAYRLALINIKNPSRSGQKIKGAP